MIRFLKFAGVLALVSVTAHAADHGGGHVRNGIGSLDVFTDGRNLDLLVASYAGDTNPPALFHQRSTDGGETWSTAVRVDAQSSPARSAYRGMDAQIVGAGDRLIALWGTAGTGFMGSGPMVTVLSADGGRTWQRGPNPADDQLTTGHGFADLATDSKGVFHLVWLDSRDGKQGLRYARSEDGGKSWSKNLTLKAETCECCWNTLVVRGETVHVLFRDKTPRDMALVSSMDGGRSWGKAVVAGGFGWEFQGCPHVGGGLAMPQSGKPDLHALVWTGLAGKSGVYHLHSADAGKSWQTPRQLGPVDARRSDLAASGKKLVATWEVVADGESTVFAARSTDGGNQWSAPKRLSPAGVNAAYPRVIRAGNGFRVFWTESVPHRRDTWTSVAF